jgi:hypothetical protein
MILNILQQISHDAVRYQIWVALDAVQRVKRAVNLFLACVFVSKTMTKTTRKRFR